MGSRAVICLAREVSPVMEELRKEARHQSFHDSARIYCFVAEKILNRFLGTPTVIFAQRPAHHTHSQQGVPPTEFHTYDDSKVPKDKHPVL